MRRQQTVHQQLEPVCLMDDDLGVFRERARLQLHLQQLRGPTDAPQRILDLVGQIANQFLVRSGLIEHTLLTLLTRLLLGFDQLHQHQIPMIHARGNHLHRHHLTQLQMQVTA